MNVIHGKIQAITKPNAGGFISIKVSDVYYGIGKKECPAKVGETVQFEAKQNGDFWNADMKGFIVKTQDAPKTAQEAPQSISRGGSDTQLSIQYQTALKASAEVTAALVQAGRYKTLSDEEVDAEVLDRTRRYYVSVCALGKEQQPTVETKPSDSDDELPLFK